MSLTDINVYVLSYINLILVWKLFIHSNQSPYLFILILYLYKVVAVKDGDHSLLERTPLGVFAIAVKRMSQWEIRRTICHQELNVLRFCVRSSFNVF